MNSKARLITGPRRLPSLAALGRSCLLGCVFLSACGSGNKSPSPGSSPTGWPVQFDGIAFGVATDAAGNVYATGKTDDVNGMEASFVVEYDANAKRVFFVQIQKFGAKAIAVDQKTGDIYVAGDSNDPGTGYEVTALVKLDPKGQQQWFQTLVPSAGGAMGAASVALDDSGNVYIAGVTDNSVMNEPMVSAEDMLVAKYDASGTLSWVRLLGAPVTAPDQSASQAYSVATDAQGDVYVTGSSSAAFANNSFAGFEDIVTVKLDGSGNTLWVRELGTPAQDGAYAVVADAAGNAYVAGFTMGDLEGNANAGDHDIVVVKYDADGNEQWSRQLGSDQSDVAHGIALDSTGSPIVTGPTEGDLDGAKNTFLHSTAADVFVLKYDASGNKAFPTSEYGTDDDDQAEGMALDPQGNIFVAGSTDGQFDRDAGVGDGGPPGNAFIARFGPDGKPK
jgi:Beta-propeller repeat